MKREQYRLSGANVGMTMKKLALSYSVNLLVDDLASASAYRYRGGM
jgi:hypothetical protein